MISVVPAQAGIQVCPSTNSNDPWMPAFAGMTNVSSANDVHKVTVHFKLLNKEKSNISAADNDFGISPRACVLSRYL